MRLVTRHYSNVFKSELVADEIDWRMGLRNIQKVVSDEMNLSLERPFTGEEVKHALFQMAPSKAPGVDGYPAGFYQRNWSLVRGKVETWTLATLNEGRMWREMNDTLVVLIPKRQNSERLEEYRPISLCSVIMKMVTKAIAIRLKEFLPQIVSSSQSAFFGGRLITDNVLIAHEALHYIKCRKTGKEGLVSLKLDMCKAYDRIEWKFLDVMLRQLGFAANWVDRVMQVVSTVLYRVKVNRDISEVITPSRGLRQGDPLSPYLFILCSEWLSKNLDHAVSAGQLKGVKLGNSAPVLSHLLFADDCMIFMGANPSEARVIKNILEEYESLSGQKINLEKSEAVFSRNVDAVGRADICNILGIKEVEKHSMYLGLPTVIGQHKQEVFRGIEDRIDSRIEDWKSRMLSRAGKV